MTALDLNDPKVLAGAAIVAVLLFTARRQAKRHRTAALTSRRRAAGLGDAGYYHEQDDYWDHPACWRRAYDKARAAHAPKSGARRAADAACAR